MATGPAPGGDGPGRLASGARSSTTTSGTRRRACRAGRASRVSSSGRRPRGRARRRRRGPRGALVLGVHRSNLGDGRSAPSAPRPRQRDDALGQRGEPGDRAQQVGPAPGGGRRSSPAARRPRGADLHLDAGRAVGQPGEALATPRGSPCRPRRCSRPRGRPGRRSARSSRPRRASGRWPARARARRGRRSPRATRRPTAPGRRGSCSRTKRPEASSSSSSRGADDLGGERHGVRRDALRRRHLGEADLGAQPRRAQVREGLRELGGRATGDASTRHHLQARRVASSPADGGAPRIRVRRCWRCSPSASEPAVGHRPTSSPACARAACRRRRWSACSQACALVVLDAARPAPAATSGRHGWPLWAWPPAWPARSGWSASTRRWRPGRWASSRRSPRSAPWCRSCSASPAATGRVRVVWVGHGRRRRGCGPGLRARAHRRGLPPPVRAGLRSPPSGSASRCSRSTAGRAVVAAAHAVGHAADQRSPSSVVAALAARSRRAARARATCRRWPRRPRGRRGQRAVRLRVLARAGQRRQRARLALPGGRRRAGRGSCSTSGCDRVQLVGVALAPGRRAS